MHYKIVAVPHDSGSPRMAMLSAAKKWTLNTMTNAVFWNPVFALGELSFMHYSFDQMLTTRSGALISNLIMGGFYGSALDYSRKHFNQDYYNESKFGTLRHHSAGSFMKDAAIDTATTFIFWNAFLFPWQHYMNGFPWEQIIELSIPYTLIMLTFSPVYGRFYDIVNRTFAGTSPLKPDRNTPPGSKRNIAP